MKAEIIISIVSIVCTIVSILCGYYIYIRKKIEQEALNAINKAEDTGKVGKEKMAEAVETIYNILPAFVRPFISKDMIEIVVQGVFDKMEEYVRKQVKK